MSESSSSDKPASAVDTAEKASSSDSAKGGDEEPSTVEMLRKARDVDGLSAKEIENRAMQENIAMFQRTQQDQAQNSAQDDKSWLDFPLPVPVALLTCVITSIAFIGCLYELFYPEKFRTAGPVLGVGGTWAVMLSSLPASAFLLYFAINKANRDLEKEKRSGGGFY
ncbi:unnamed protein product [Vitrella brassicaformis CCMP3155]|uniref:Uncharacterized protein n=1 Tax=Vitrella brassicaformis (strain CCMP3155) TaxID=1169540 RepID=A0A0G4H275_VITBC|nr:unnamed protein product [Vitrella brassicaformis CCMP3155]|eukprot:CEM37745.1 unnamed protein product [Vitrella brassicaformis CCMP3155]